MHRNLSLRIGAAYLAAQSVAACLWWASLLLWPSSRPYFRPPGFPDASLLAFFLPDLVLFIGAGFLAALRLWQVPGKALVPLSLHVGGAAYAALYCWSQSLLTGQAWLATIFMSFPLIAGPIILWRLSLHSNS